MNSLEESRLEINAVDDELVKLFERRMRAMDGVISYKIANNLPILDSGREKQNIERNVAKLQDPSLAPYFTEWYQKTMDVSKEYQKSLIPKYQKK